MRAIPLLLAVAAALAGLAAPAGAAVRLGGGRIVVDTGRAQAVIDRSPFRVAFRTATGRTVLRELAAPRRAARVRGEDPEPFAQEGRPDPAVYAPLSFEVGRERRAQWTGSYWFGNLLFARREVTVHSPREVVSARRAGRGVRLVVSTTDPRRDLVLRIGPDRGAALRLQARPTSTRGVVGMLDSFSSGRDERFHGFGGRHWGVDQAGRKLYGWLNQENFGGAAYTGPAAQPLLPGFAETGTAFSLEQLGGTPGPADFPGGEEHYLFPNGPDAAYYVQAQFVSSRPYGFLLNRTELSRWRMRDDLRDAWQVQASAPALDYTVAVGPARRTMADLSAITGRHLVPPAWAQGPTVWRAIQVGAETAASYRAKVEGDLATIERLRPPLTAYAFEGWELLGDDAFVRRTIERLHALGIRAILYVRAYVSENSLATDPPGLVGEVARRGLAAKTRDGDPYFFTANESPALLYDFTNPATVRFWQQRRLKRMLDLGADGFMQDFGEHTFDAMRFADGSTGEQMHNRFPVLYHRLSRAYVDRYAREHRGGQPVWFFTRAGYSGRPGSAASEMGNFPGDETTNWEGASGLRSLAPDMLNRAVGGSFGYTTDIGGYADLLSGATTPELFTRWSEWSALTPYFRVHNSVTFGTRMPWDFGEETYDRWRAMADLHQRALPLIRRLWAEGRRTGVPPTRPLWLAAPGDRRAAAEDQEWLLGDDVLVAPVVEEGAAGREVTFPRGCWASPQGGERVRGPAVRRIEAPPGRLPYFMRCGARPF